MADGMADGVADGVADCEPAGDELEKRRLQWRCRRGMRELDALLTRWLSDHYPTADTKARAQFALLLEQEDDVLWNWLLGRSSPQSPELAALVDQITASDGHGPKNGSA